jgi:hypothetical protein
MTSLGVCSRCNLEYKIMYDELIYVKKPKAVGTMIESSEAGKIHTEKALHTIMASSPEDAVIKLQK